LHERARRFRTRPAVSRRVSRHKYIQAKKVDPLEKGFAAAVRACMDAACAFEARTGRRAAITEMEALMDQAGTLYARMRASPARTQAGKAAKARALLSQVLYREWRGPADDLDRDKDLARALLGELAAVSAEQLASI
jgi:hypothetical protein